MASPQEIVVRHSLIIGLPETGKTTFLAALWHVLNSNEVPGSLQLVKLEGNRKHLNAIRRAWLEFREVGRTISSTEEIVSMKLRIPNTADVAEAIFPDMSGESFRKQWTDRKWTKEYEGFVRAAKGILIFVHSRTIVNPIRIDSSIGEAVTILADEEDMREEMAQDESKPEDLEWQPKNSPTQVQLVELLQFIDKQRLGENLIPVAVAISAWDLDQNNYDSPNDWLSKRLPLIDQYLRASPERFPSRVYGISAQGAPYTNATVLQQYEHQSDRIMVAGADCIPHDITCPIRWLMETSRV